MTFFLRLKHWQVFIALWIGYILGSFDFGLQDPISLAVLNAAGNSMTLIWYFIIGLTLDDYLDLKIKLPRTLFIFNAFFAILSSIFILTYFDGFFSTNALLGLIWILYLMFAMAQFLLFPAKVLKSFEKGKKARIGEYFSTFLYLIFWPIGIWFIQPRLNKIAIRILDEELKES